MAETNAPIADEVVELDAHVADEVAVIDPSFLLLLIQRLHLCILAATSYICAFTNSSYLSRSQDIRR